MDQAVEHDSKIHITVIAYVEVEPVEEEDGEVVVDVQERQLLPTAFCNNKKRVCKIQDLGQVKHVEYKPDRRIHVLEGLAWHQGIARLPRLHAGLDAHIRTQHHLADVVQKLGAVQAADLGADD